MKIAIIGAGAIGQAIGSIIKDKKNIAVVFWDKDQTKVPHQRMVSEAVEKANLIFVCVPSFAVRAVAISITPHLTDQTIVVSVAKGIESDTNKTIDEILRESLGFEQPIAMLCGPMLADEIMRGMPAVGTVGTTTRQVFTMLHELFSDTLLRVEYSRDIHGVAIVSVLKNIYTIGVGIGEGLGYGDNWRGWFMNQALNEMITILKYLGGTPFTVHSAAGLGDFIATSHSPSSRNHTVGQELGAQGQTTLVSEGVQSLSPLIQLVGKHMDELPILSALQKIILDKHHAQPTFQALFEA